MATTRKSTPLAKARAKARRERVFAAMKERYSDCDLDDHIHEVMSLKAADINNAGFDAQLEFLAAECGLTWIEDAFLRED